MNKYYVLRRGSEFKDIFTDESTATLWTKAGWEIRPVALTRVNRRKLKWTGGSLPWEKRRLTQHPADHNQTCSLGSSESRPISPQFHS